MLVKGAPGHYFGCQAHSTECADLYTNCDRLTAMGARAYLKIVKIINDWMGIDLQYT